MHPNHKAVLHAWKRATYAAEHNLRMDPNWFSHPAAPAFSNYMNMLDEADHLHNLYVLADLARVLNQHADQKFTTDRMLVWMFLHWKDKLIFDPTILFQRRL